MFLNCCCSSFLFSRKQINIQESTKLAPARVSFKLHAIYELFQDATKAANMQKHIQNYLADGAKLYKRIAVSTQVILLLKKKYCSRFDLLIYIFLIFRRSDQ